MRECAPGIAQALPMRQTKKCRPLIQKTDRADSARHHLIEGASKLDAIFWPPKHSQTRRLCQDLNLTPIR
jgi:hypothetical protein